MTQGTKTVTKKKLQNFMNCVKRVLEKTIEFADKVPRSQVTFMLKGVILFKKEDLVTSKVLDYEVESTEGDCLFTYEKFL